MADFLTRLVERARGTAATVQPLIAPSFSPAPELRADRPPRVSTYETAETEGAHSYDPYSARRHHDTAPPDPQTLEEDSSLSRRDAGTDISSHTPRQILPPTLTAAPPAAHATGRHAEIETAAAPEHTSAPRRESQPATNLRVTETELLMPRADPAATTPTPSLRPHPRAQAALDTQVPTVSAPQASPSRAQPASAEHTSAARVDNDEASHGQAERRAEPVTSAEGFAPRVIQVTTVRREVISSSNESAPARAHVVEPPPTVHVSIGRVEVRAVAPPRPAAPRDEKPPAPKVSLDEYLRAQSGRRV